MYKEGGREGEGEREEVSENERDYTMHNACIGVHAYTHAIVVRMLLKFHYSK